MADITRTVIPQEFQDLTSARMLRAPEPQYFHATLLKGMIGATKVKSTAERFGLPLPGRDGAWAGVGADITAEAFAGLVLNDASGIFEAVEYFDDFDRMGPENLRPGHTVRVNRPIFTDSTYTLAARTIAAGTTISTTGTGVSMGQVDLTLRKVGGPYLSSAVVPYVAEKFDMSRGIHKAADLVGMFLQRDCDKSFDKFMIDLFDAVDSTNGIVRPDGMTADNDSGAAGSFPMSYQVLAKLKTRMVEQHVMPFRNGRYALVLAPRQVEQLKTSPDFKQLSSFMRDINPLFTASYQFTIDGFDVYQSTTLTTASNSSSVTIYYGQAFGRQVVGVGCPRPPEAVMNTQDNYGESVPLIWLSYIALTTLDNRYTYRVTTD